MTTRAALALAVAGGALLLGGCGVDGLAFTEDQRLDIVRPGDHDEVTLPFTLAWDVDPGPLADGTYTFGVVIDRSPPPPGRTVGWLFRDDDSCGDAGCPDPAYRAEHGVFTTDRRELEVGQLPANATRRDDADHEATVFLLDHDGRRVGESAWSVEVSVPGSGS